jgi:hypothetical protein
MMLGTKSSFWRIIPQLGDLTLKQPGGRRWRKKPEDLAEARRLLVNQTKGKRTIWLNL